MNGTLDRPRTERAERIVTDSPDPWCRQCDACGALDPRGGVYRVVTRGSVTVERRLCSACRAQLLAPGRGFLR